MVSDKAGPRPAWDKAWPIGGLEALAKCPVCGTGAREVLHRGVVDNVLFCAPGRWTYWSCSGCGCAYPDPRPTSQSIQLAYQNYHTHSLPQVPAVNGRLARAKQRLKNGYRNWRFGTDLQPSTALGVMVALCVPSIRLGLDREFRHLPPLRAEGRLLDLGFGGGAFLETARLAGWRVSGIDPDPEVVSNALERGLDVSNRTIDELGGGEYDVITVSHVVEHVHDPVTMLFHCFRLLRPGGMLWVETPNIDSLSHARFGRNWRGLEAPRHLVVFNRKTLHDLLHRAGFVAVRDLPQASPCHGMFAMSDRMQRGISPDAETPLTPWLRVQIAVARVLEVCLGPSRREFLAVVARKPDPAGAP